MLVAAIWNSEKSERVVGWRRRRGQVEKVLAVAVAVAGHDELRAQIGLLLVQLVECLHELFLLLHYVVQQALDARRVGVHRLLVGGDGAILVRRHEQRLDTVNRRLDRGG